MENPLLDIQAVGYVDFCLRLEVGDAIEMKEEELSIVA